MSNPFAPPNHVETHDVEVVDEPLRERVEAFRFSQHAQAADEALQARYTQLLEAARREYERAASAARDAEAHAQAAERARWVAVAIAGVGLVMWWYKFGAVGTIRAPRKGRRRR